MKQLLDCGHEAEGQIVTTPSGQTLCLPCTTRATNELLCQGSPIMVTVNDDMTKIMGWSGETIATVIYVGKVNKTNGRLYITAQDLNGRMWHGQATRGGSFTLRRLYR